MLWSYWHHHKVTGLVVPQRFYAFRTRYEASSHANLPFRRRRPHRIVALILREEKGRLVPEFNVRAVGTSFSLPAKRDGDHFVVTGEVPAALWYEDNR